VGAVVAAGGELVELADIEPLRAAVELPERDLAVVREGLLAEVSVDAFPGVSFPGRVVRVAPFVAPDTGTFAVRVELDPDATGRLRPGLFSRVRLVVDRRDDVLVVPRRALLVDGDGDVVYVVRDGQARAAPLELGHADGDRVEVRSGVAEGDRVVVLGQDSLAPGTPVRVIGEAPAGASPPADARATAGPEGGGFGGESPPDPDRIRQVLERLKQSPGFQDRWDAAVRKDPELATDVAKQAEWLGTQRERFRGGR
jgi:membrane fusion protein (multidrug efflux system)